MMQSCYIEQSHEQVLLAKGWKQFDVIAEIKSLNISLRSIENKYICQICNTMYKLRREVEETTRTYRANRKIGNEN